MRDFNLYHQAGRVNSYYYQLNIPDIIQGLFAFSVLPVCVRVENTRRIEEVNIVSAAAIAKGGKQTE